MTIAKPIPHNFVSIKAHDIAGCATPKSPEEVEELYKLGYRTIVFLTEPASDILAKVEELGITHRTFEIEALHTPAKELLLEILAFIDSHLSMGNPVVLTSETGTGRSKLILAMFLRQKGNSPEHALQSAGMLDSQLQRGCVQRLPI